MILDRLILSDRVDVEPFWTEPFPYYNSPFFFPSDPALLLRIMADSPAVRGPLDPKEQPILDALLAIRTKLELLKQDRSTYVKSEDVVELYKQVIEQVVALNGVRGPNLHEESRGWCCFYSGPT